VKNVVAYVGENVVEDVVKNVEDVAIPHRVRTRQHSSTFFFLFPGWRSNSRAGCLQFGRIGNPLEELITMFPGDRLQ
jgi:hypothetical protein